MAKKDGKKDSERINRPNMGTGIAEKGARTVESHKSKMERQIERMVRGNKPS